MKCEGGSPGGNHRGRIKSSTPRLCITWQTTSPTSQANVGGQLPHELDYNLQGAELPPFEGVHHQEYEGQALSPAPKRVVAKLALVPHLDCTGAIPGLSSHNGRLHEQRPGEIKAHPFGRPVVEASKETIRLINSLVEGIVAVDVPSDQG